MAAAAVATAAFAVSCAAVRRRVTGRCRGGQRGRLQAGEHLGELQPDAVFQRGQAHRQRFLLGLECALGRGGLGDVDAGLLPPLRARPPLVDRAGDSGQRAVDVVTRRRDLAEHAGDLGEAVAGGGQPQRGGDALGRRHGVAVGDLGACHVGGGVVGAGDRPFEGVGRDSRQCDRRAHVRDRRHRLAEAAAWPIHVSRSATSRSVWARTASAATSVSAAAAR